MTVLKTEVVTFRVTKAQYQKIAVLAKQANMTVNEWTRHTALGTQIKPILIQIGTTIDDFLNEKDAP